MYLNLKKNWITFFKKKNIQTAGNVRCLKWPQSDTQRDL